MIEPIPVPRGRDPMHPDTIGIQSNLRRFRTTASVLVNSPVITAFSKLTTAKCQHTLPLFTFYQTISSALNTGPSVQTR